MRSSRTTTDTCIAPGYETDGTRVSAGTKAALKGHGKQILGSFPLATLAASGRSSQPQRGTLAGYEARYGTARREDDTADFTTCQSAWEHLIGIMEGHVDKLGVDFSVTSLSPDHPSFWNQLAARTWHGEAPPSSADIQGLVDGWTADRSADQIMACLLNLWKDEATPTAGGLSVLPLAPCCPPAVRFPPVCMHRCGGRAPHRGSC